MVCQICKSIKKDTLIRTGKEICFDCFEKYSPEQLNKKLKYEKELQLTL